MSEEKSNKRRKVKTYGKIIFGSILVSIALALFAGSFICFKGVVRFEALPIGIGVFLSIIGGLILTKGIIEYFSHK